MQIIESYKFSEIKGFSRLFLDFANNGNFISSRFPANSSLINDENALGQKSSAFGLREQTAEIILKSLSGIEMTSAQELNLEKIKQTNCLCVVSGQQVGFLGGPLYTALKAAAAIVKARQLNEKYNSLEFVPVFWVEDNDHDGLEASRIYSVVKDAGIETYDCNNNQNTNQHHSVNNRIFDNDITDVTDDLLGRLSHSSYYSLVAETVKELYRPGNFWHSAFIGLLNKIFAEEGLLFMSASHAINSGVFQPLVLKELANPGAGYHLISSANTLLEENGYHIQAKASPVNLFYHDGSTRIRIEYKNDAYSIGPKKYDRHEMLETANENPSAFSPNVLLRPIFQDYVLPTALYVAGPGEIGYCSQITELYDWFGVRMPAFVHRSSATLLDSRSVRFMDKNNLHTASFMKNSADTEHDIAGFMLDESTLETLKKIKNDLPPVFNELLSLTEQVDTTLNASVRSAEGKALQSIENIEKKIISALKRKNEDFINHYKYCSQLIYPMGSLQERVLTPLYFINMTGFKEFSRIMITIARLSNAQHHFVSIV